jgi:osmoprotectant transport system permease protein
LGTSTKCASGLMGVLSDVITWLTDPANWEGSSGILVRVYEHLLMSVQAIALGASLAIPVGLAIGHTRRFEFLAVSIGNIGRALPSFGIVAITYVATLDWPGNIGFWPTFIALTLLTIPPVLTNTYVGIKGVDLDTLEAARGMGLSDMQSLRRIEVPLAAPLIVAGLRTASVQVVATATLGAFTGWGGLGRFIVDGFAVGDDAQIAGGAILVAALAVVTEMVMALIQRIVSPRISSSGRRLSVGRGVDPGAPELGTEVPGTT